jgi:hypothetical protein
MVNLLYLRPDFIEVGTDATGTVSNCRRNGRCTLAAVLAGARAISEYSFADAGHDLKKKKFQIPSAKIHIFYTIILESFLRKA